MTKYKSASPLLILFVPTFVVLILYGYLGSFARMLADDYCLAYNAHRLGLLKSIWYWYLNWNGRYTAYGADWVMEKVGVYAIPAIPPFLMLIWLVFTATALHLSLQGLRPQARSKITALSLGTIFLFVVLLLSPNIPQSLYWWSGMRSYSLPLILLTLYAVLFQIGVQRTGSKKVIIAGGFASFIFTFANGGLSETYIAFQLILFIFLLVLEWLIHRYKVASRFIYLLAGLAGSTVSMIVMILAPGNAIRQSAFPSHPDILSLLQISLQSYLDFLLEILRTPEKFAGLIGILLITIWLGTQSERTAEWNRWLNLVIFTGAFSLSFACFIPGVYATSEPPPTRTFTIPVFILVVCLLHSGFSLGQKYAGREYFSRYLGNYLFVLAALLVGYSSLMSAQYLYNSRAIYIEFAKKWDETDALILRARANNLDSVQIPAMVNWAGLEYPTHNKNYWPNLCYSAYYDIQVFGPNPDPESP